MDLPAAAAATRAEPDAGGGGGRADGWGRARPRATPAKGEGTGRNAERLNGDPLLHCVYQLVAVWVVQYGTCINLIDALAFSSTRTTSRLRVSLTSYSSSINVSPSGLWPHQPIPVFAHPRLISPRPEAPCVLEWVAV
jgi:hypothetical protein